VLDAQHFGVPQRRRRVFVVACLGDWKAAAEVLSIGEGLRGYIEAGGKKRKSPASDAGSGVDSSSKYFDFQAIGQYGNDGSASTLMARDYKDSKDLVVKPVVIDRAAFNQGVNAQYEPHIAESEVMDSLVARGPHAVGVPYRKSKRACSATDNETWVLADSSNTLNNFDLGDTRTTHAVVQHQMPGSVAPTIGASGPPYSRTGNERVEAEALAISFSPGNLVRKAGPNPSSETFPTLSKDSGDQNPHVAYVSQGVDLYNQTLTGDLHVPLRTAGGHDAPAVMAFDTYNQSVSHISKTLSCAASDADHVGTVFQPTMAVRRLTPEECEKLQGFKSGWSKIPWKGKPESECPDGPRYKACGNSMAVPCMFWIGNRIAQYEAKA
jgi:DNA (cytosine-5)-methyltransferase 1